MIHYWWIPLLIVLYAANAYVSTLAKDGWKWVGIAMIIQAFGLWPIVARYSKNLAIDAMLYDFLLLFSMYGTFWYLGVMDNFNIYQWIGFTLCIIGMIFMKGAA